MFYNLHFLGFVIDKEKAIDIINNQYIYEILGYCIYDSTSNKKKYITKNGMKAFIEDRRRFGYNSNPIDFKSYDISYVASYNYTVIMDFSYERSVIITEDIEHINYDIEQDKLLSIGINLKVCRYSCLFDIGSGLLLEGSELKNYCSILFGITIDLSLAELSLLAVYSFTNDRCEIHAVGGDFILLNSEANFDWYTLWDMREFAECLQNLGFHEVIKLYSSDKLTVFEFDELTVYVVIESDIVIGNNVKHAKIFRHMQINYSDTVIVLGHNLQKLDLYNVRGNLRVVASRGRHYNILCDIIRDFHYLNPKIPKERLLDYYDRGELTCVANAGLKIEYYSLD